MDFIQETTCNMIASDLSNAYFNYFGFYPSDNERRSWHNSLRAIKDVFQSSCLNNQGVSLEFFLPLSSKRLDCMVTGRNEEDKESALIIELKQWEETKSCDSNNEIITWLNGNMEEILHPSAQVKGYKDYLQSFVEEFYKQNPIKLDSCVYLHNYEFIKNDPILDHKFDQIINDSPLFGQNDFDKLTQYVKKEISHGEGMSILKKINQSKKKPSKKLLDEAYNTIHSNPTYTLIDEQQIVYDHVITTIKKALTNNSKKHVIICKGGPGTGKSVIAINLLAELTKKGKWAEYVTGSASFTQSYKKAIGGNAKNLFRYTNSYVEQADTIDCLIVDEAHRLREKAPAGGFFSRVYSGKPQVQEIIDACHVAVFFIDDEQQVKPDEIGTSKYIKDHALSLGCDVWEEELQVQFRCSGNDGFVQWLDNTLALRRTANVMLEKRKDFDVQIFDDPKSMEDALRVKMAEGNTARIASGFIFKWSTEENKDGTMPLDVVIGNYMRPWNLRKQKAGMPASTLWAYNPKGFDQIGCIYSCQGFEFDYIGIIFGNDIFYDFDKGDWIPKREHCFDLSIKRVHDDEKYMKLVKNIYRVLLSRGMKGCYIYFIDKNTERFVKSRMLKESLEVKNG